MKKRKKEIFERQRFSELKQRLLLQEQQLKEEQSKDHGALIFQWIR